MPSKRTNRSGQLNDSEIQAIHPAANPPHSPPSTKHDASSSYARYVPSKSKPKQPVQDVVLDDARNEAQPRKKRRKVEAATEDQSDVASSPVVSAKQQDVG